ncbi:hypothetical protein MINT15_05620 [Saccharomonospora viridis]|uniref:Uncharacterized protein n=1 Tax=Saccharomonospora viridis TaxID=1852 RepID=A0A837DDQ9_9PSEU|nr:hypothetical protein MINT15_05620 [Saccharomonospora viridis]
MVELRHGDVLRTGCRLSWGDALSGVPLRRCRTPRPDDPSVMDPDEVRARTSRAEKLGHAPFVHTRPSGT